MSRDLSLHLGVNHIPNCEYIGKLKISDRIKRCSMWLWTIWYVVDTWKANL